MNFKIRIIDGIIIIKEKQVFDNMMYFKIIKVDKSVGEAFVLGSPISKSSKPTKVLRMITIWIA